ncbi:MAG: hypothetical protein ABSB40_12610 [Nitrososphaeria archaeon]|jgi:hypothetical protein
MTNPDFTTNGNNIRADSIRIRWEDLKNERIHDRISFILDRKDWNVDDVLNSIEKMTYNLRDAAIFLSGDEYRKFDEDLSKSITSRSTSGTVPIEINGEIRFCENKIKLEKKAFLVDVAAQLRELKLHLDIKLFSSDLRKHELSHDDIILLFEKNVAGYDKEQAERIMSYFTVDYKEYDEAVKDVINERFISRVTSKSLRDFLQIKCTPYYFPAFEIQYRLLGTDCLSLVPKERYAIVDVEVHQKEQSYPLTIIDEKRNLDIKRRLLGYYDEFISLKDLNIQPLPIFTIPIRLLSWLIEDGTRPYGIIALNSSEKEVSYKVDGYADVIRAPVEFIRYLKELSGGKGFNELRAKLVENGLMYEGTNEVIEEQMKPRPVEPSPPPKPKVIERLEIIQKNPSFLHYSVWGKKFGITKEGAFDCLDKYQKEGTVILTPESDGVKVQLTDKGLQMLRQGKSLTFDGKS